MAPPIPSPRQIDKWQDAEHNAAEWMRYWGYEDAVANPSGSDGGIDIRASQAWGQVKFQGAPVGRPALQRLVGAGIQSGRELFFFTGSAYSRAAIEYANAVDMALFVYDPWGRMRPANTVAKSVVQIAETVHQVASTDSEVSAPPHYASRPNPEPSDVRPTGAGCLLVLALICFFLPINWLFQNPGYDHPWYVNVITVTVTIGLGLLLLRAWKYVRDR